MFCLKIKPQYHISDIAALTIYYLSKNCFQNSTPTRYLGVVLKRLKIGVFKTFTLKCRQNCSQIYFEYNFCATAHRIKVVEFTSIIFILLHLSTLALCSLPVPTTLYTISYYYTNYYTIHNNINTQHTHDNICIYDVIRFT